VISAQVTNLLAKEMLAELATFGNYEKTYSQLSYLYNLDLELVFKTYESILDSAKDIPEGFTE
jgi:hypothetical protein